MLEGKRIYQLIQDFGLAPTLKLAVDQEGLEDAKYITLQQLLTAIGHAAVTLGLPHNGLDLNNQLLSLSLANFISAGACPILPNDATKFLNGIGQWVVVSGGGGTGDTYGYWNLNNLKIYSQNTLQFAGNVTVVTTDLGDGIKQLTLTAPTIPPPTPSILPETAFEFCVEAAYSEVFNIDIYATSACTLIGAALETDASLIGVSIKINGVSVTGLNNMTIHTVAMHTATALNTIAIGDRITLTTTSDLVSSASIIRGKIILQAI